jgi:hypothetical protein
MVSEQLNDLMKALEAGSYNAAPSTLTQGAALQMEDLSPVMELVTFDDSHIKLQKMIQKESKKSTLHQFNRQLDYGTFGGSAQYEGGIGEEDTSNFVRVTVPMCYYSTTRRVSVAANMVALATGGKMEDMAAKDAAMKLAADIEFDLFRGNADFSNAGVFDGNPLASADIPNMRGIDAQIRESDAIANTQDLMFAEYGSNQSVIVAVNGVLAQSFIEDASVKSAMQHGKADKLLLDPIALSQYNKIAFAKERIMLAGSAQDASGANLRTQWTSSAVVSLEPSRFLSAKTAPARARVGSPLAPAIAGAAAVDAASLLNGTYVYYVSAVSERGESVKSANFVFAAGGDAPAVVAGQRVDITITPVAGAKYYNVYRSNVGGGAMSAKFIGRIKNAAAVVFNDLGNFNPGSITGYLVQADTHGVAELAPFTSMELAVSNLSMPKAFYQFLCVGSKQPRKNVILTNVTASL